MTIRMIAIDLDDDSWAILDKYLAYGAGRTVDAFASVEMVRKVETIKFNERASERRRVQR